MDVSADIKGSFAETVCRLHFEAMGYNVEPFGIERIAPAFAALTREHAEAGSTLKKFNGFTRFPDFLISRIDGSGKKDAVLVEVKFRKKFNRENLTKELKLGYEKHLQFPILFYVISEEPERCVRLMYSERMGFWSKADDEALTFPLYRAASEDTMSLAEAYNKLIMPIIGSMDLASGTKRKAD